MRYFLKHIVFSAFVLFFVSAPCSSQDRISSIKVPRPGYIVSAETLMHAMELSDPNNIPQIRKSLSEMVLRWIDTKHDAVGTVAGYVTGQPQDDLFGDKPAIRLTIIMPSEVFRDSTLEWDKFQVLATWMYPDISTASVHMARNIYMSIENYSRRNRGRISPNSSPNLDWDFSTVDDLTLANAILKQIGDKLVEIAINDPGNTKTGLLQGASE